EVLAAGEHLVDGGELPGETDRLAHLRGLFGDIEPGDDGLPGIRPQQGREDAHERRLAGAVRAEQREDRAARDVEFDPSQHVQVPVGLLDSTDLDRGGHDCSFSASSIAVIRRARSLSAHRLPVYDCANVSAKSTGSSPTTARTG